jgi:hypothetical protein
MTTGNPPAGVSVLSNAVTVPRFRRWGGSWGSADASAYLRWATEVQAEKIRNPSWTWRVIGRWPRCDSKADICGPEVHRQDARSAL